MEKGFIKSEAFRSIENELTDMTLLSTYLQRTNQTDQRFSSIRKIDELVMLDGGIKIPNIVLLDNTIGTHEILKSHSLTIARDRIAELEKTTKLKRADIIALMQDGMSVDEIEKAANALPFKDIAESEAIREMIRKDVDPEQLSEFSKMGVEIVPLKDGSVQVNSLEKLAEIDEKGELIFDQKWLSKQLNLQVLIDPKEQLVVQDHTKELGEKSGSGYLQIVPLSRKREDLTKEEIEKEEIAKELGESPDNIISVITIEDREAASKLFNRDIEDRSKPLIVRFRNNNFKVMEEKPDGSRTEMIGFEATPISKQLAANLKDTRDTVFTNLLAGEIRAGKTNPNIDRYNLFQIRRPGETIDDDQNMIMYVGYSGETDINAIKYQNRGNTRFERVPVSSVYPRNIYMENSNGTTKKTELLHNTEGEQKDIHDDLSLKFEDIQQRYDLLQQLRKIEERIHVLEEKGKAPIEEDQEDLDNEEKEKKEPESLDDLYKKRSEILKQLGVDEEQVVEIEEEFIIGQRRNRF